MTYVLEARRNAVDAFRLLQIGEIMQRGDQWHNPHTGTWHPVRMGHYEPVTPRNEGRIRRPL